MPFDEGEGQTQSAVVAIVEREGDGFVAKSWDIEVASQGVTMVDAIVNLQEAIDLYYDEATHDE